MCVLEAENESKDSQESLVHKRGQRVCVCVCVCVCVLEAENESKDLQESLVHKTLGSAGTAIQLSSLTRQATWAGEGKGSVTAPGTRDSVSSSTHSVEGKKQPRQVGWRGAGGSDCSRHLHSPY